MHKGKNRQYVSAGVQHTPSVIMNVRGNVRLPDSEVGAPWYDADQKPFHADTVMEKKRQPLTVPLNSAMIFLCALFVVFSVMTLSRMIRKAEIAKNISAMETSILDIQRRNADLALQVAEAHDLARIGYAATSQLQMTPASEAETIAVHAPDTRPFGENAPDALASAKTGSR